MYTLCVILVTLVPDEVLQRKNDIIQNAINDVAEKIIDWNASSWTNSHKQCFEWTCRCLTSKNLVNNDFRRRLKTQLEGWISNQSQLDFFMSEELQSY